jgi:hypothetical protein
MARITLPGRAYGANAPRAGRSGQGGPLPADSATPFGCALRDATRTIDPMTPSAHPVPYGPGNAAKNAAFLRVPD